MTFSRAAVGNTLLLAIAVLQLMGCKPADPQVSALRALTQAGYSLSVKEFHRAAVRGDLPALRHFLACGTVVDVPQFEGEMRITALRQAIRHGQDAAVVLLLEAGAKLHLADTDAENPLLQLAVASGSAELVRFLLGHPDCPLAPVPPLLLIAAEMGKVGILEALLEREPDLILDAALCAAAAAGQLAAVDGLLQRGANPQACDEGTHRNPLMLAALQGHETVVDLLLQAAVDRFQMDSEGHLAADLAQQAGHSGLAQRLWGPPTLLEREIGTLPADLKRPPPDHWLDPKLTGAPAEPVTATIDPEQPRVLWPLHHVIAGVHAPFLTPPPPRQRIQLLTVRLSQLPLHLLSVDEDRADFEDLHRPGETLAIHAGEEIGQTGFELDHIRRSTPELPLPEWLPFLAVVKHRDKGTWHAFIPGVASRHGQLCAVIRILPTEETYEGHAGETFRLSNSAVSYVLKEIAPREIAITDNLATFQVPLTPAH